MTVLDDARGASATGHGSSGPQFDRTPPQAVEAEQSVLGAMMLSKDAIADVIEIIRPGDFYRPAHQLVYDAVLDLYSRGEPADAVTVSAELTRIGQLGRVGGAPYLHTLISMVPTAANAGYYAAIVADRATLRRLVTAGTRIVQMGYDASSGGNDAPGSVDDVVDRAQAEVYEVTERRLAEDYVQIESLLQSTLDEIERISATGGIGTGIPTGFHQLDEITNGLHPGQMITVAGRPGSGKALALDTPLPTPTGWTTMGAVAVGDELIDAAGRPTRVVAATEVMTGRPCYEVEFSDGSVITADAEHQWLTTVWAANGPNAPATDSRTPLPAVIREHAARVAAQCAGEPDSAVSVRQLVAELGEDVRLTAQAEAWRVGTIGCAPRAGSQRHRGSMWNTPVYSRRALSAAIAERVGRPIGAVAPDAPSVVTTAQLAASTHPGGAERRTHAISCTAPLALPQADLALAPYALGVWLGAGTNRCAEITCADGQIIDQLTACGVEVTRGSGPLRFRLGGLRGCLRELEVVQARRIPAAYLRASQAQRRDLLRGLLDADGHPTACGSVEFSSGSRELAADVRELVVSLGYRATLTHLDSRWTVRFTTGDSVFGVERKAERQVGTTHAGATCVVVVDVRPVASVPVRCVQVDNAEHLYLAGPTMVPTHNSTLALDFARAAAVAEGKPTAIFSLEMGRLEIMMRLFSAESSVRLNNMRSGHMNDQDWRRLALRSSELADAPLFIDDSPNLTMMEIRAKARRLKQRNDLSLVVIDYLQLMTSGKRVESRQQEVSEFSRSMKLLAKELEVPVVALSQLNRGPEQRTDKKPMLSDLRESGCLPASTRVWRADTGAEVSIEELARTGERNLAVWALDSRLRMVPRVMTHAFSTGTKPVFRLRLASGRTVDATANHPFYTYDGWRDLDGVKAGDRIAIARSAPCPRDAQPWDEYRIVMLAHLIGDGSFVRHQPLRYASVDEANLAAVTEAARGFGVTAVRDDYPVARVATLRLPAPFKLARGRRNPIAAWLDELGLFGLRSHEKFVPAGVFGLPDGQLALFLRHLWATDGCVHVDARDVVRVFYASTSRRLADDVTRLLTRFGITARIKTTRKDGYRDGYHVHVVGCEQQETFLRRIGCHGARGAMCERAMPIVAGLKPNTNVDTVPLAVWEQVRGVLHEQRMPHRQFAAAMSTQFCGSALWKRAPSRARLARVAAVLKDADLEMMATNDVFWDSVVSIDPLGEQPVYDATVPGEHNFLADGVMVHNSIEQDSDMVLLVHRPDLYETETERAGEADLIIAKHRNGITTTVPLAFQGHYSRFADLPS